MALLDLAFILCNLGMFGVEIGVLCLQAIKIIGYFLLFFVNFSYFLSVGLVLGL